MDTKKIVDTFKGLEIILDIEISDEKENQNNNYPVIIKIKKDKNAGLYELRDYFKVNNEYVEGFYGKRNAYKKILVYNLKQSFYNNSDIDMFLKDEITTSVEDINKVRSFQDKVGTFLICLQKTYETILNVGSYKIKVNLVE